VRGSTSGYALVGLLPGEEVTPGRPTIDPSPLGTADGRVRLTRGSATFSCVTSPTEPRTRHVRRWTSGRRSLPLWRRPDLLRKAPAPGGRRLSADVWFQECRLRGAPARRVLRSSRSVSMGLLSCAERDRFSASAELLKPLWTTSLSRAAARRSTDAPPRSAPVGIVRAAWTRRPRRGARGVSL
jgi:hypothetical protein